MNTAYFVKVSKSMSWNELKEKINKQKKITEPNLCLL